MKNVTKKKNVKKLSALVIGILLTNASQSYASSTVESEIELVLPKTFQEKMIEQKWKSLASEKFNINWQIPDQILQTSTVDVKLQDLHLDVSTFLTKPQVSSNLVLSSSNLSGTIKAGTVSVDQYVEREMNGIIGRFRIQAECKDVVLTAVTNKVKFSVAVKPSTDGKTLSGELQDLDLSWQPDAWQIGDLNCTGAVGFDDMIRQQVLDMAKDSTKFTQALKPELITYLESYLKSYNFDIGKERQLITSRPDIKASMIADSIQDLSDGTKLKGRVIVIFNKAPDTAKTVLTLKDANLNAISNASVRVPEKLLPTLMQKGFAANTWMESLKSSSIPGFSSIMSSRIKQFFAWPELTRYSKSTVFPFQLYSDKDMTLKGSALKYDISGKLIAQMLAPRSSGDVPMMRFSIPFSSKLSFTAKEGVLTTTAKNTDVSLGYVWDENYVRKYNAKTKFMRSTVEGKIQDAVYDQALTYKLPLIPVMDGLNFRIESLEAPAQTESVRIILGVNP
jgi:hypothetical protein